MSREKACKTMDYGGSVETRWIGEYWSPAEETWPTDHTISAWKAIIQINLQEHQYQSDHFFKDYFIQWIYWVTNYLIFDSWKFCLCLSASNDQSHLCCLLCFKTSLWNAYLCIIWGKMSFFWVLSAVLYHRCPRS